MIKYQSFSSFVLFILFCTQLTLITTCHSPCQGITRLELDDGHPVINIESPSVPTHYKHPVLCRWLIKQTNRTQRIKLQFDMIDIALDSIDHSNRSIGNMIDNQCKQRFVQVMDIFAVPHLVGKFCGNQIPPAIISAGNMLQIKYSTQGNQSKFKITVSTTEEYCGTHIKTATKTVELLSSPKYSNPYPSNARCFWKLQAAPNHVILLEFIDIHIQHSINCSKDGVVVYNGAGLTAPLLGLVCGINTDSVKPSMVSTSNQMFIAFKSDDTEPGFNGFSAYYVTREVTYCEQNVTIINQDSVISTPGYPNGYSGKTNCYMRWLIQAPNDDDTIKFSVHDVGLPTNIPCVNCYLRIYDGPDSSSHILSTICSETIADDYISTNNELYIEFYSVANWVNFDGFSANVTIIEKPEDHHGSEGNHTNHHPHHPIPDGPGYSPIGGITVMASIVVLGVVVFVVNRYKMRCCRAKRRRGSNHFALINEAET